jgi:anthranilate phosphoribosyltransferase
MFAPGFHPAMKHAMPVRRELGVRTVFNVLGPLTNPAGATAQVIGVYSAAMAETLARVLVRLGTRYSLVVHGGGHDEIILSGPTHCVEILDGRVRKKRLTPADFGFKRHAPGLLAGGDKEDNANILRRILSGEPGPARDAVVANAAAALWVADRAAGRKDLKSLKDARRAAESAIDSGAAKDKLERLAALSNAPL